MTANALVNFKEKMKEKAKEVLAVEVPRVNRIGFKSGHMYIDNQAVGTSLLCYILANRRVNSWFPRAYNPNQSEAEAPHCWSVFRKEDEAFATPDKRCLAPQAPSCNECTKNAFGSAANGGKGKACGNRRRISLIPAGTEKAPGQYELFTADQIARMATYTAQLPPTSDKNFTTYARLCANTNVYGYVGVVTKLSLVPDSKSFFKVVFEKVSDIGSEEVLEEVYKKMELAEQDIDYGFEIAQVIEQATATGKF